MRPSRAALALALVLACAAPGCRRGFASETRATPPAQPAAGPGGSEYKHARVAVHVYGSGAGQYWIFEPDDPPPAIAPVIVFNHGWGAMNAAPYGGWIAHLVKRGNIVVYPRYQADLRTTPVSFTANAIGAVKHALARLEHEPGHVKPDLDKIAVVGHSAGGNVGASMVALATASGLPVPKALMCVEPGKTWSTAARIRIPLADLSKVPAATLVLSVVGDRDGVAHGVDAKRVFEETTSVPRENKDFITLVSDTHGKPALAASHFAPLSADEALGSLARSAPQSSEAPAAAAGQHGATRSTLGALRERIRAGLETRGLRGVRGGSAGLPPNGRDGERGGVRSADALDFYGLWKLFDALTDAAFYGTHREYALGNTPEQRFMGKWSDGRPVKELIVAKRP